MTAVPLQRMTAKGRQVPRMQSSLGTISSASKIDQPKTLHAGQLKPNTFIEIRMEGHGTGKLEGYTIIPDRLYFLSDTDSGLKKDAGLQAVQHILFL